MNLARLGLIVNPSAGGGEGLRIARQAIQALAPRDLLVGAGEMGADAMRGVAASLHVMDWQPHSGKARTQFLAERFATENLDALVVIGGDGTLADVALTMPKGQATALLGIGVGSANVGPLITCLGKDVPRLAIAIFVTHMLDGLVAGVNDVPLGLGFNDVVIGFTVLATMNGRVIDVDAAAALINKNMAGQ